MIVRFVVMFEYSSFDVVYITAGVQFGSKAWLPDTSRCEWYGVGCIDNETVVAVRGNSNLLYIYAALMLYRFSHYNIHFRAYLHLSFFPFFKGKTI